MGRTRTESRPSAPLVVLAIAIGLAFVSPTNAVAQQPDDAQAKRKARRLLRTGDRKLRRGERLERRGREERARQKFSEALADYQAAFDAYPQPKIYFPIAQAEQKLGRYLDAYRHYRQLLEEVPDLGEKLRERVDLHIEEVQQKLGAIRFVVVPDGAAISVDGTEIGNAPLDEPYWTNTGEHTYEVSREGYTPVEATVTLEEGQVLEETITLEEIPKEVEEPKPTVAQKEVDEPPAPDRMPLWIGLGTTGALAATATVTGILAVSKHGAFTDESKSPAERADAKDAGETLALTTDVLLVGTIAAGAFTAYYYYRVYRPAQQSYEEERQEATSREEAPSLWMAPYAEPRGAGLAVGGRF